MKRAMIFILSAALLCAITACGVDNGDRSYAKEQCRKLMHEYNEAVAKGDRTAANRAAAIYNDYIFSYSSVWGDDAPEKLYDCK